MNRLTFMSYILCCHTCISNRIAKAYVSTYEGQLSKGHGYQEIGAKVRTMTMIREKTMTMTMIMTMTMTMTVSQ